MKSEMDNLSLYAAPPPEKYCGTCGYHFDKYDMCNHPEKQGESVSEDHCCELWEEVH